MVNNFLPKHTCDSGFKNICIEHLGHYEICGCGEHVNSNRQGMTIRFDSKGYKEVNLSNTKEKISKKYKIDDIMVRTYLDGYDPDVHYIIHLDEDINNNNKDNLRYELIEYVPKEPIVASFKKLSYPKHPNYNEYYEVSICGKYVKSLRTGKMLSQFLNKKGYYQVQLNDYKKKTSITISVHQLVACTHVKTDDYELSIDHINRVRTDNRAENLRFVKTVVNRNNTDEDAYESMRKPVVCFDLNDIIIKEYPSITEVLVQNPGWNSSNIHCVLRGFTETAYGFKWRYKNDEDVNVKYVPKEGEIFKKIVGIRHYNKQSKEWDVIEFDKYEVSNFGTVKNSRINYSIGYINDDGKKCVSFLKDGSTVPKVMFVHTLMAHLFLDKPADYESEPEKYDVVFKDYDPNNLVADNLEYISKKEYAAKLCGVKVKAVDVKDGSEHVFDSIENACRFLKEKNKDDKNYRRGIKACFPKDDKTPAYQSTAFGYRWTKM